MNMSESDSYLLAEYQKIHQQAYQLAGELTDLSQRASVYFHMYQDSQGHNIFPLIAAHGALWASGYFSKGMKIGRVLSMRYCLTPKVRKEKMEGLIAFANAFRDINRRVCAEAYIIYHFTKLYGDMGVVKGLIPHQLGNLLNKCHLSVRDNSEFSMADRLQLFLHYFLWEQETIVAPAVEKAIQEFDWPLVKYLAMKPNITFSYFGSHNGLQFENFSSKNERIIMGTKAYLMAESAGFKKVENALNRYDVLPDDFVSNADIYFHLIKMGEFTY
jgi:hypothetical protein